MAKSTKKTSKNTRKTSKQRSVDDSDWILPKGISIFDIDDPIWYDTVLPLGFKQHIEHSIFEPLEKTSKLGHFSFILFGPPGTGKTTIIKSIAKQLKWEFFEIGPQHFLKKGLSLEEAMKTCLTNIKQVVKQKKASGLTEKIFFFDEIDELLVSRGDHSDRQSRIVTTMMLPLIQELRKLAKEYGFVFFVATNHIERFDSAITRLGRFDLILPLGPPDRVARFLLFNKFLDEVNHDMIKKYNTKVKTETIDIGAKNAKIPEITANLDILSRVSARLSLKDIEEVCKNVAETHIARFPFSLQDKNRKSETYLDTHTFVDWIYKYRNIGNRNDIEKFYKDRENFSRGSTLYTKPNTLQEKIEHEFNSLHVKHNLPKYDLKWKINTQRKIDFSFWNLAGLSPFTGRITGYAILNNRIIHLKSGKLNEDVPASGGLSNPYYFLVTPKKRGILKIVFEIDGRFNLRGIEGVLHENKAELSGAAIHSRKFIVQ